MQSKIGFSKKKFNEKLLSNVELTKLIPGATLYYYYYYYIGKLHTVPVGLAAKT